MTAEEIQRNIEFIIASQARLAAAQELDREERKATTRNHEHLLQQLAKTQRQMSELLVHQGELLVHQSERMDRFDRVHEELSRDIKHLLNMILGRLPPQIR